jgi:acetyltransferase-like isoleucine patch superfamily enzyme
MQMQAVPQEDMTAPINIARSILDRLRRLHRNLRCKVYTKRVRLRAKSCGVGVKVNGYTTITANTVIGDYSNFNGMAIKGNGNVVIGRYLHSGTGCKLMTTNHNFDGGSHIPYGPGKEDVHQDIKIGDFVWLGDDVTVLGGVEIGEGAVIQVGSVVVSDIPPFAVAGGHPAKVFKYRDKARFEDLKKQGKFF